jgi:hypothetical protein
MFSRKDHLMSRSINLTTAAAKIAAIAFFITPVLALSAAHADLKPLDGAGISVALNGKTISGERGGTTWVQTFDAAGVTFYGAAGEVPTKGRWVVREDRFCSQWPSAPDWACYDMLRDGDVVVFISESDEEWTARISGSN